MAIPTSRPPIPASSSPSTSTTRCSRSPWPRCRRSSACRRWCGCRWPRPAWRAWPTCAAGAAGHLAAPPLRFAECEHDDATRVVVIDHGQPVGFVVDRVASVVSVERADRGVDTIRGTVDTDLLTGMIKADDGHAMIMVLDVAKLIGREFADIAHATRSATVSAGVTGHAGTDPDEDATATSCSWSASRSPARNTPSRSSRCRRSCRCPSGSSRCPTRRPTCWAS